MKAILFCTEPYDFAILKPLAEALVKRGDTYLWYVLPKLFNAFPYKSMIHTNSLELVETFEADAIFTPSNDLPYWLRGVKVQLFHGLSRDNDAYFELCDCFDLYATPSPYYTEQFAPLAEKEHRFEVVETGWSKLDALFAQNEHLNDRREALLKAHGATALILYAPTFAPELSSAMALQETLHKLADREEIVVLLKFHTKTPPETLTSYQALEHPHIVIVEESDVLPSMQMADLMISDTSSVVYEFLLLNKPLLTYKSQAASITWTNYTQAQEIYLKVIRTLQQQTQTLNRQRTKTIAQYHPYSDGEASVRVIEATESYIATHGVPEERKLPLLQKWKVSRKYKKLR
ncbi:MAG TPA: CDP-glycerol--glycerophosphate glycerophosphotransferase [Campylobacterales bacterium]|nr:CDP-glycerol--glycerophosphate glycerophosphotransferase [Campylobacterales bacterium]